jgi:hypothetical protein
MESIRAKTPHPLAERLASEVADVEAAIALVRSGVATTITLTSLRFAQQLSDSLAAGAAAQGVRLEASFWPEDDLGDLLVSRIERGEPDGSKAGDGGSVVDHG